MMKLREVLFQIYRLYVQGPEHPAKLRIVRWLGYNILPKEGGVFEVNKNIKLYLHPYDWIEYLLLKDGQYEPLTLDFIEHNLSLGQTALFAGVNFGLHLILASRCVSNKGCVIGVEPQPSSLNRAYQNIMLNNLPENIRLVSGALGEKYDLLPMGQAPENNRGSASLVIQPIGSVPLYIYVDYLPSLLSKLGINNIDLMLLDVEGYELNILKTLTSTNLPKIMIVEVNPYILRKINISEHLIYDHLSSLGYTCWTLFGKLAFANDEIPERNVVAVREDSEIPCWCQT